MSNYKSGIDSKGMEQWSKHSDYCLKCWETFTTLTPQELENYEREVINRHEK